MNELRTDDEQVEALKKWWKENGTSIISGVAIGLALIGGWQGWNYYSEGRADAASNAYVQFQQAQLQQAGDIVARGGSLIAEYGDTRYATLTAFALAKTAQEQADLAQVRRWLQWVIDNEPEVALAQIARVRLARVELGDGQLDAAEQVLNGVAGPALAGEVSVLRGDLARARGDRDEAITHYREGLAQGAANLPLLRMKLAELGAESVSG